MLLPVELTLPRHDPYVQPLAQRRGPVKAVVVGGLCLLTICGPAPAAPTDDSTGWYVGAGIGQSKGMQYCDPQPGITFTSCDDTGTAWRLLAGYQFNRYVGVEGGYLDLGEFSATFTKSGMQQSVGTQTRTGYLAGIATLPIGSRFGVFVEAGAAYWSMKGQAALGGAPPGNLTNNGVDFIGGAGVQAFLTRNFGVRAQYEYIPSLGNSDSGTVNVQVITASVIWKF